MALNESIRFVNHRLMVDDVALSDIVAANGTPVYVYSLRRAVNNYRRLQSAFANLNADIHYSAKANANLTILRTLISAGAGIDAVSAGEIHRALTAGVQPEHVVFAGVGKTPDEIRYALEQGVGWFNVENVAELDMINTLAAGLGRDGVQIALRLNPEVTADTHPHIATGHGGAKFGMTAPVVHSLLSRATEYPQVTFRGLHVHIGSQLGEATATRAAVETALNIARQVPTIDTLNIGGGFPAAYRDEVPLPSPADFASAIAPLVGDYHLILEPGRSIIADAGLLVTRVLYTKDQGGQHFVIVDGSMTELMRPALYGAYHAIVPLTQTAAPTITAQVVGPVCETTDVLGRDMSIVPVKAGDDLALLTAGAYGMVMASNYNARPRPAEVAVGLDGQTWQVIRQRETWDDLIALER